jgi:hypothetical protein
MAAIDPETKAATEFPINKSIELAKWSPTARLVRLIQVPLVLSKPLVSTYGLDVSKVDVSGVAVYPVHQQYGGTSLGFGTDLEIEAKLETEPGYFIADGIRFEILDFVSTVPDVPGTQEQN